MASKSPNYLTAKMTVIMNILISCHLPYETGKKHCCGELLTQDNYNPYTTEIQPSYVSVFIDENVTYSRFYIVSPPRRPHAT